MKSHVLLATTLAASLVFVAQARADFTIRIIVPLTGPGSPDGIKAKSAMQSAADEINKNGGILGEKLSLKFGDNASDALQSTSVAKSFLDEKINFVINAAVFEPTSPPVVTEPVSDILALSGAQVFYLTKTLPQIDLVEGGRTSNFSAQCYAPDPGQAVVAADYVIKNFEHKKIAVIDDQSDYSKTLVEAFKTALNRNRVTEVLRISVAPGARDQSDDVEKLKQAGVDVIYYGGHYPELYTLVRGLRKNSVNPIIIGGNALSNVNYQTSAKKEADGTIFTDKPHETIATDLKDARAALTVQQIPVEDLTLRSYAAVHMLAAGIRDELCYGHSEFSLITNVKDGRPVDIYLDPRAVAVRMSSDDGVGAEVDKTTGQRKEPTYTSYMWKSGKIVPITDSPQAK